MTLKTTDEAARQSERDTALKKQDKVPAGWVDAQDSLAAASGLSVLLINGHQPPSLAVSNNNSICRAFQSSPIHQKLCDPYCGVAFERAMRAGQISYYRCHAGLSCFTMPVQIGRNKNLATIGGRAFLTSTDYRALAERIRIGDLQDLLTEDLFKNVIFAARKDLDDLARRLENLSAEFATPLSSQTSEKQKEKDEITADITTDELENVRPQEATSEASADISIKPVAHYETLARSEQLQNRFFSPDSKFDQVCGSALKVFAEKQGIASLALLLRDKALLTPIYRMGRLAEIPVHVEIGPKDARLALTAKAGASIALSETPEGFKPLRTVTIQGQRNVEKTTELFPLVVGDEVKGVLLVGDTVLTDAKRRAITAFCRDIAMPLEVLRLRHELEQRGRFVDYLQSFSEHINTVEPAETYRSILRQSTDILRAERSSLLLFDETSNELAIKAAVGFSPEINERIRLGEGISGEVLHEGRPLVVHDLELAGRIPAPAERHYKTKSFISYPIIIGGRKVGVLNVTDKVGGGSYDDIDLSLLEVIAPQMALALDRAEWHEKAAQFQLMSITDPLTGLLNRRYLEERLAEELNRSRRYNYPMSFMMIDIDDFKLYNDRNGHQAGDLALELTAQCLKSALRSADVASRYGGEEFCILLPQTSQSEALAIAERIRRRVERTRYPHGKAQPLGSVTVSIGISSFTEELETAEKIIGAADRALYLAKHHGKNIVQGTEESSSENAIEHDAEDA